MYVLRRRIELPSLIFRLTVDPNDVDFSASESAVGKRTPPSSWASCLTVAQLSENTSPKALSTAAR